MLSHRQLKWIRSLAQKKYRDESGCFVAEGPKVVGDLLPYFDCVFLGRTADCTLDVTTFSVGETAMLTGTELERASFLKTPREVIAVFRQPATDATDLAALPGRELCLALDTVQDPGNLGTIVRLADWFGIRHIFCSPSTSDVFAPKVVQATMGALARVRLHYGPLTDLMRRLDADVPVYGTFLDGDDLYAAPLEQRGLLVMGNEGNGISPEVEACVRQRLYIPNYPLGVPTSESLNVAIATAVACAEFRRRANKR